MESADATGARVNEGQVASKARNAAIHKAVEAYIDAIRNNHCLGGNRCFPKFSDGFVQFAGDSATHNGGEVSVTALAKWGIKIGCKLATVRSPDH